MNKMRIVTTLIFLLGLLTMLPQQNFAQTDINSNSKIARLIRKSVNRSERLSKLKGSQNTISSLENSYCSNNGPDTIYSDDVPPAGAVDIKWSIVTNLAGEGIKDHLSDWSVFEGSGPLKKVVFFPQNVEDKYYSANIWFSYVYVDAGGNDIGNVVTDGTVVYDVPTEFNVTPDTSIICDGNSTDVILDNSQTGVSYSLFRNGSFDYQQVSGSTGTSINFPVYRDGLYTVIAQTTGSSCSSSMNGNTTVIVHDTPTAYNFGPDTTHLCIGDTANLVLSSSESGMNYFLYRDGNQVQGPIAGDGSSLTFKVKDAGDYTVEAFNDNDNSCSTLMNGTSTVIVHDNPAITSVNNDGPSCENGDVQLSCTVTGGSGNYFYTWNGPDSFTSSAQNPLVSNIQLTGAGYYRVIVADDYGCSTNMDSTKVVVHPNPTVVASNDTTICEYGTAYIGSSPSGGTGTYTFNWSGPGGFTSSQKDTVITNATVSQSGKYIITVTDGSTCSAKDSLNITVNDAPVATAVNDGPVCEGGNLTLHGSATQGTGTYSYSWFLPDNTNISNSQDTTFAGITKAQALTYTLIVNDGNCKDTTTTTVVVNDSLKIDVVPSDTAICEKVPLQFTSYPSGGSGNYTYSWTGPNGFTSTIQNPLINSIDKTTHEGKYNVTVTDATGCTYTVIDSSLVSVNEAPVLDSVRNNGPLCKGETLNLEAFGHGANAPLTYGWTGPNGFTATGQTTAINNVDAIHSGFYNVILTDAFSCSDTASTNVEVNMVTATISASNGAVICAGTPITFNARGENGSGNYNYDFHVVRSGNDTSVQNGSTSTWTVDTLVDQDEVYVIVTDNNTLCNDQSGSVFVVVHPNPVVSLVITQGNDTICSGTEVEFTADPGFANYVYYVNGDIAQQGTDNVFRSDTLKNNDKVSVNVTTSNGCSSSTPAINMTVYDTPTADLTADPGTDIIEGTSVEFTASGGTTYEFFVNGVEVQARSNDNTIQTDTLSNGATVSVNVYGDGDCVSTATLTMTVLEGISPLDVSATATEYCAGSGGVSIYLASPQNGITYDLIRTSDNSVVGTITYDGTNTVQWDNILGPETYKVEGYYSSMPADRVDMNNQITVVENPLPVKYEMTPTGVETGCNNGNGFEIKLVNSDTGFSYQLLLNNFNIGSAIAGTGDTISFGNYANIGIYNVLAINDITGCTEIMTGTFEIKSDDSYNRYNVTGDGEYCEGEAGAFITLEGSDTGVEYRVLVDGADINDTWTADVTTGHTFGPYTTEGNYTIVVISTGGCNYPMNGSVNVVEISLPQAFDMNVENGGHFCEDDAVGVEITLAGQQRDVLYNLYRDGTLVATDTGKVDDATMILSFGKYHEAGQYSVTATTQVNGCEQAMNNEVRLIADPLPVVYDVTTDGDYCAGDVTHLYLSGSEPDVEYRWERIEDGAIGTWTAGNGGLLSFEVTGTGTYLISARRVGGVTSCATEMNGRYFITEKPNPVLDKTLRIKAGTGLSCDNGAVVIVENSEQDVVYELYKGYQTGNTTTGNGGDAEFSPIVDVDATYYVIADLNGCSDLLNNSIYINIPGVIERFGVTGSGDICNGDPGVHFGLDGSEAGVTYKLYLVDGNGTGNDKQIGDSIVGTGNALTFDIANEEGEYYVMGDNGVNCRVEMTNRVTLTVNPLPVAFTMIGSGYFCDVNDGAEIGLDGQEYSVKYLLQYDDGSGNRNWAEATGGTTNDTIIFGKFIDQGLYTVVGVTDKGCTSSMHGEVTVAMKPAPVNYNVLVSDTAYCSSEPGVEMMMEHSEADVVYSVFDEFNTMVNETTGTGADSLSLGMFTKGTYTVIGAYGGDACETLMNNGDTIIVYEYETPFKFNVSAERANVCGSEGTKIILDGSENGRNYVLTNTNDTVIGTGNAIEWDVYSDVADTILYEVVALSDGSCDLSMGTAEVIYKNSPVKANIITENDTTQFCAGLPGIVIGIDTSEINIGYQLLDSLNNIVDFITGNGDTAFFNNPHGENDYTVKAVDFISGCSVLMDDTLEITENPVPEVYKIFLAKSDGSTTECENQCTGLVNVDTIKLEMSQDFVDYLLWTEQPNNTTAVVDTVRGTMDELSFGARAEGGLYTIEGVTEQGCRAFMSGSAYMYQSPLIAINDVLNLSKGELIGEVDVVANDILLDGIDSLSDPNKNIFFELDTTWTYFDEHNVAQKYSTIGKVSINDEGKLEYEKLPSFYGRDSVRYIIYNRTHPDRIDTATVFIFVGNVDLGDGESFLIPNAFSPNGDNVNDKFVITGIEDKQESKLEVFNRWGTLVYRSKGQNYENDWDGKSTESSMVSAGEDLPNGTYYYVFTVKINREGKVIDRKYSGFIELRR